jgi:hypothetical protein
MFVISISSDLDMNSPRLSNFGGRLKHAHNFGQYALAFRYVLTADGGRQAIRQVIVEELLLTFVEGGLDSLNLPDDLKAGRIPLDHPLNALDVPGDAPQSA